MRKLMLTLSLLATSTTFAADHPYYGQMKPFHTYVTVDKYYPLAHNFWLWYRDDGFGSTMELAANSADEVKTAARLPGGFVAGSIEIPDNELPGEAVPQRFHDYVQPLIDRAKALDNANITDFKVRYLGDFHNVVVKEFISKGDNADLDKNFARKGEFSFRADASLKSLTRTNMSGSGLGVLCSSSFPEDCRDEPLFVNFVLPKKLEGSEIIASSQFHENEISSLYKRSYKVLEAKILSTMDQLNKKTYVNPIANILARQGNDALPSQLDQEFEMDISAYAYGANSTDNEDLGIRLKVSELNQGPVVRNLKIALLEANLKVEINWALKSVEVTLTQRDGSTKSYTGTIQAGPTVTDGTNWASPYLSISNSDPNAETSFELDKVPAAYQDGLVSFDAEFYDAGFWKR